MNNYQESLPVESLPIQGRAENRGNRLQRGFRSGLAALALLGAACSPTGEAESASDPVDTTTLPPAVAPETIEPLDAQRGGGSEGDVYIEPYECSAIPDGAVEVLTSREAVLDDITERLDELETFDLEISRGMLGELSDAYGVTFSFLDDPDQLDSSAEGYRVEIDDTEVQVRIDFDVIAIPEIDLKESSGYTQQDENGNTVVTTNGQQLLASFREGIERMRVLPPELFELADLREVYITGPIEQRTYQMEDDSLLTTTPLGGFATDEYDSTIIQLEEQGIIAAKLSSLGGVLGHELFHRWDAARCENGTSSFPVFESLTPGGYAGHYDWQETDPALYRPTQDRVFASPYGAASELEDRATIFEDLLYLRGIVQPEDPDYGSLYQQKQEALIAEMVREAPVLLPFFERLTDELRSDPDFSIDQHVTDLNRENGYTPLVGEVFSQLVDEVFESADRGAVLYARDTVLVDYNNGVYVIIYNPIIANPTYGLSGLMHADILMGVETEDQGFGATISSALGYDYNTMYMIDLTPDDGRQVYEARLQPAALDTVETNTEELPFDDSNVKYTDGTTPVGVMVTTDDPVEFLNALGIEKGGGGGN